MSDDALKALHDAANAISEAGDTLRGELQALRDKVDEQDALIEELKRALADRDEAGEALERVKWWMHEVLVLHMPIRDPRAVLKIVERALGE